jgi:hypothetical protein
MKKEIIPIERIAQAVRWVRGEKVLLDFDLAALYGVPTKTLNQAVKRNGARFPGDFMFQFSAEETHFLRSQFVASRSQTIDSQLIPQNWSHVTSSRKYRGERYRPDAVIEQGVAMLSSVLNSERVGKHDEEIAAILEAIRQLMEPPEKPRREIGFHVREKAARYRTPKVLIRHA